jgi:hypothetical protein
VRVIGSPLLVVVATSCSGDCSKYLISVLQCQCCVGHIQRLLILQGFKNLEVKNEQGGANNSERPMLFTSNHDFKCTLNIFATRAVIAPSVARSVAMYRTSAVAVTL